jgi:hypothetical protein
MYIDDFGHVVRIPDGRGQDNDRIPDVQVKNASENARWSNSLRTRRWRESN